MAWRRLNNNALSEPKMISLLTHLCVTRPEWLNHIKITFCAAGLFHWLLDKTKWQWCDIFYFTWVIAVPSNLSYVRWHYSDVIMGVMASQITSLTIVYSTAHSGADQRKHQSSAWLVFVRGIRRSPVNSRHTGPVTRNMFISDDVIMKITLMIQCM